jgi:hypothetical protein
MPALDEPTEDVAARAVFDVLIEQNSAMPSLEQRARALDYELSVIESSFRVALRITGTTATLSAQARRIVCLRRLLDLVWFLDRHSSDPVLRKRLAELKKEEAGGGDLD